LRLSQEVDGRNKPGHDSRGWRPAVVRQHPDTDLRVPCYFDMSEEFFAGLQTDQEFMERKRAIGEKLKAIKPRAA
jgi:hypothetical protein